jgi:hypothetical protein
MLFAFRLIMSSGIAWNHWPMLAQYSPRTGSFWPLRDGSSPQ